MPSKKKIQKSFEKFAKASAKKNLVAPARTMTAATTPTAQAIGSIADSDTDAAIADYGQRSTDQAGADYAALPQPSYSQGEQESTAPWIAPTDALANLAASPALEAQMRAASSSMDPRVVSHEQAHNSVAVAMVNAAFGPRHR